MGLLQVVWQPICKLTKEIETYTGASIKSRNEQLKAIQNSEVAELRTAIYIAKKSGTNAARKVSLLRAYISQKPNKAISHFSGTAIPQAIKAVAHATYLKGNMDKFLNVMAAAKGDKTTGCLVTKTTKKQQQQHLRSVGRRAIARSPRLAQHT
uniref:Variant surface glycoprotein n=1 Tax=Trypanosoma brucei TaxID=5691 RepID=A0A1V0FZD4_9TRYP|nr:variant surface glycoprotein [Trypanosoma brucei]